MPKLLKNGMVQLHMPRTGGTSLARDVGVQDYWNGLHDGVNQIPDHWKDKKRIATWRDPVSWSESMINYLIKINKADQAHLFAVTEPLSLAFTDTELDPTFGLWDGKGKRDFIHFATSHILGSWYELYTAYFLKEADVLIPMKTLNHHVNKS